MAFFELLKTFGSAIGALGKPLAFKDTSGDAVAPEAMDSGALRVVDLPFEDALRNGDIAGKTYIEKKCWVLISGGGFLSSKTYTIQSSGVQRSVKSDSGADSSGGAGARKMRLNFIKGDGSEGTEDIIMNGSTAVDTASTDVKHVQDFFCIDAGSNGRTLGRISIYDATGGFGSVFCSTNYNENLLTAQYFVPLGKTLTIYKMIFMTTSGDAIFTLYGDQEYDGGTYKVNEQLGVFGVSSGQGSYIHRTRMVIPALSRFYVWNAGTGTNRYVYFHLFGWVE